QIHDAKVWPGPVLIQKCEHILILHDLHAITAATAKGATRNAIRFAIVLRIKGRGIAMHGRDDLLYLGHVLRLVRRVLARNAGTVTHTLAHTLGLLSSLGTCWPATLLPSRSVGAPIIEEDRAVRRPGHYVLARFFFNRIPAINIHEVIETAKIRMPVG